jgi:hypothetical protein
MRYVVVTMCELEVLDAHHQKSGSRATVMVCEVY